ncbi:hypothetical protein L9F63_023490, partial [Diploptera punctata]
SDVFINVLLKIAMFMEILFLHLWPIYLSVLYIQDALKLLDLQDESPPPLLSAIEFQYFSYSHLTFNVNVPLIGVSPNGLLRRLVT